MANGVTEKIAKTNTVTSQLGFGMPAKDSYAGPSDCVPWLNDRKWAYIRMDGTTFGDVPLNVELKSTYSMKSPPQQHADDEARRLTEDYIRTRTLPTQTAAPKRATSAVAE